MSKATLTQFFRSLGGLLRFDQDKFELKAPHPVSTLLSELLVVLESLGPLRGPRTSLFSNRWWCHIPSNPSVSFNLQHARRPRIFHVPTLCLGLDYIRRGVYLTDRQVPCTISKEGVLSRSVTSVMKTQRVARPSQPNEKKQEDPGPDSSVASTSSHWRKIRGAVVALAAFRSRRVRILCPFSAAILCFYRVDQCAVFVGVYAGCGRRMGYIDPLRQ